MEKKAENTDAEIAEYERLAKQNLITIHKAWVVAAIKNVLQTPETMPNGTGQINALREVYRQATLHKIPHELIDDILRELTVCAEEDITKP